jgi:hypothetical protein
VRTLISINSHSVVIRLLVDLFFAKNRYSAFLPTASTLVFSPPIFSAIFFCECAFLANLWKSLCSHC